MDKTDSEYALKEARKIQDIGLTVPPASVILFTYAALGEFYKIVDTAPEVIDLIEKEKRESDFFNTTYNQYSYFCGNYGVSMGLLGSFEAGKTFLAKGLRNAEEIGEKATIGLLEMLYGFFFYCMGDWKPAIRHYENSIKNAEETNSYYQLALGWSFAGSAYSYIGDPDTGKRYAETGLNILPDTELPLWSTAPHYHLGLVHLDLGNLKKAQKYMGETLRLSKKYDDKFNEGWSWISLGRIWEKTDPPQIETAEENILKGVEILKNLKLKPEYSKGHLYLGKLYLNAGDKEKAVENLKKAEGMFREMGMDYWLERTQEVLNTV